MYLFLLGLCLTSASVSGLIINHILEQKESDRGVVQPDNIITIQQFREK